MSNRHATTTTTSSTPSYETRVDRNVWLNGWRGLAAILALQVVACTLISRNTDTISPDAISYLRLGQYYRNGQWDLAVSGYWSPLLSWMIAAALLFTGNLESAGQVASGITGILFTLGSHQLFRRMPIRGLPTNLLTAMAALFVLDANRAGLNSDVLMSGILFFAISQLMRGAEQQTLRSCVAAGVLIGTAYLGKAVALPLGLLIAGSLQVGQAVVWREPLRAAFVRTTAIVFFALLIAAPWIAVLSIKFHKPTIGTAGAIAHSLVGPKADPVYHHVMARMLLEPEPGRISWWEDPSNMAYDYWSPLASWDNAQHQARVIGGNLWRVSGILVLIDFLLLGLAATFLGFVFAQPWTQTLQAETWRWASVPVLCNLAIYLPLYAPTSRYYFHAFPYLAIVAFGWWNWLTERHESSGQQRKALAWLLTMVGVGVALLINWFGTQSVELGHRHFWIFIAPYVCLLLVLLAVRLISRDHVDRRWLKLLAAATVFCSLSAGNLGHAVAAMLHRGNELTARQLAGRIDTAHLAGSIGALPRTNVEGLTLAYFTKRQFYGNVTSPEGAPDKLYESGVQLVIARRDVKQDPTTQKLLDDRRFENLDAKIFPGDPAAAEKFPDIVFAVRR